jgi:hypothetical protein
MVIVYLEGDDLPQSFQGLGTSLDPFDVWFRQRAKDLFSGLDLAQPLSGPISELIFDGLGQSEAALTVEQFEAQDGEVTTEPVEGWEEAAKEQGEERN